MIRMYTEEQFQKKIIWYSFFISLAVVQYHANNIVAYGLEDFSIWGNKFVYYFETFIVRIWDYNVPFFFMISGYLFFRTFDWSKIWIKYKSRIRTILIPFFCWCLIYYLYYIVVTRIPVIRNAMNEPVIVPINLATLIKRLWIEAYSTFWFLKFLIIFIIWTPVIYLFLKNRGKYWVGLFSLLLFYCLCYARLGRYFDIASTGCYLLGAYVGINHKTLPMVRNKKTGILACGGLIVLILLTGLYVGNVISWRLPTPIIPVILWYSSSFISFDKEPQWWMKISFFTYCLHDMLLEGFEKIFLKILGVSPLLALLDFILMPLLTFVTIIAVAWFLKRYLPGVWRLLTGSRG